MHYHQLCLLYPVVIFIGRTDAKRPARAFTDVHTQLAAEKLTSLQIVASVNIYCVADFVSTLIR